MIFNALTTETDTNSAVLGDILSKISAVSDEVESLTHEETVELARAVELFVTEMSSDSSVDSEELTRLASRALSGVGEDVIARRLLLFGTGMIRPSEWIISGNNMVWVLDLKQLVVPVDTPLELFMFPCLNAVIDAIADLWDESDGEGALGLKHVCDTAEAFLGNNCKNAAKRRLLANEIGRFCAGCLSRSGKTRGWSHTPEIVDLDVK